ncbi:MAG: hypothetical protein HXX14_09185 [Bacteroidetes bacterium]|nr:hypothetical protein [Bacteroidota bacterium]
MKRVLLVSLALFFLLACKKEATHEIITDPTGMAFSLNHLDNVFFTNDNGSLIGGVYHHKYTLIKTNSNFDIEWVKNNYDWGTLISGSGWGSSFYSIQIVKAFQRTDGTYVCIGSIMSGGDVVFYSTLVIELNKKGEQLHKYEFKDLSVSNALQTSDGGYVLFGNKLVKLDAKFNQQWTKNMMVDKYYPSQIISTVDGGFALTGSYNSDQAFLKKLDSNGNEVSNSTYKHNASPFNENGSDLIQLQDKGFLIIGRTRNINQLNDMDCQIIRTDIKGDTIWTKKFGNSSNEWLDRFISYSQNEFVVQGTSGYPNEVQKSLLVKFDLDGKILDSCRVEKFPMMLYSPQKYYVRVFSSDTAHINFAAINSDRLFAK